MKSQLIAVLASGSLLGMTGSASSAVSVDGDTPFGSIISITADGLFHWEKGSNRVATGDPIITGIWGGNNQGPENTKEIGLGDIHFDGNGDILAAQNIFDTTGPATWAERNSPPPSAGSPSRLTQARRSASRWARWTSTATATGCLGARMGKLSESSVSATMSRLPEARGRRRLSLPAGAGRWI